MDLPTTTEFFVLEIVLTVLFIMIFFKSIYLSINFFIYLFVYLFVYLSIPDLFILITVEHKASFLIFCLHIWVCPLVSLPVIMSFCPFRSVNQLTGFYMIATLAFNELKSKFHRS